jgi:hypothetical protein
MASCTPTLKSLEEDDFMVFKAKWTAYENAAGIHEKTEEVKLAFLTNALSDDVMKYVMSLELSEDEKSTTKKVLDALEKRLKPKTNITYERYIFNSTGQQDENIDEYVRKLQKLAKTCKYGNLEGEIIKDRVVIGVKSNTIRRKLLVEEELTLQKAIDIAKSEEMTEKHIKAIVGSERYDAAPPEMEINRIVKNRSNNYHGRSADGAASAKKEVECKFCGLMHEYGAKFCPAYGKTCDKCKKMNHFSRVCSSTPSANSAESYRPRRQATATRRQQVNVVDEAEDEEYIYALNDDCDFSCGGSEYVYEVQPGPSVKNMKKTLKQFFFDF